MRDLLYDFHNPCVMDIKMGTRTFLESEVSNTKARKDLYEKVSAFINCFSFSTQITLYAGIFYEFTIHLSCSW